MAAIMARESGAAGHRLHTVRGAPSRTSRFAAGVSKLATAAFIALVCLQLTLQPADAAGFVPGQPLPLPADPEKTCKQDAFAHFTAHNPRCALKFWKRANPDEECCQGLADYFGADSLRPTANCWCVPEIWDWMQTTSEKAYIRWKETAQICSRMSYIVGFHDPEGDIPTYCNGTAPTPEQLAPITIDYVRNPAGFTPLKTWLKNLSKNGLVECAVAVSIMSAIGLSAMVWPIAIELLLAAMESWKERKGGHAYAYRAK